MDETERKEEMGVVVLDAGGRSKTKAKSCRYNPKQRLYREFVLASLSTIVKMKASQEQRMKDSLTQLASEGTCHQISALDALANSGIAGIQWKKRLGGRVCVTLADLDNIAQVTTNAEENSLTTSVFSLDPKRIPGDPRRLQAESEIHTCQAEAKTMMMMEAFQFIYVSPVKACTQYLEPVFHSISHGGLVCLIVTDVSMFARVPHVVQRLYMADVVKTEYLKEMAARISIANFARSAAKFGKGISPQYVVSREDSLLVCVKVSRGHGSSESSLTQINKLLHCRLCEERVFLPNQLAPLDDPYSFLPCRCRITRPGKTAVILGPMWKGPLYDNMFLHQLQQEGEDLKMSSEFSAVLSLLMAESVCLSSPSSSSSSSSMSMSAGRVTSKLHEGTAGACQSSSTVKECCEFKPKGSDSSNSIVAVPKEGVEKDMSSRNAAPIELSGSSSLTHDTSRSNGQNTHEKCKEYVSPSDQGVNAQKRELEEIEDDLDNRTAKVARRDNGPGDVGTQRDNATEANVLFYQKVNKFKSIRIPKLDRLVTDLQASGFRASRTHFDPCALRTSASVEEFINILQ